MIRILLITLISFYWQCSFTQGSDRKLLFIGMDGCRWDALETAATPALDELQSHAITNIDGLTEYPTWSATGWSGMLTGVWHTKHGVTENSFTGANYAKYPDFISRIEAYQSDLNTYSVVHWSPINTNIVQSVDTEVNVSSDLAVKEEAVRILTDLDPDVLFVAFDDVDHAGHVHGFLPTASGYLDAIEITDGYISEILSALHNRPGYAHEDWLVIVSTDHGGISAGHGGGTLEERSIFTIFSHPDINGIRNSRTIRTSTGIFNEAQFQPGTFASPIDQSPFLFGENQDFTRELWVKAWVYSEDPAFISNKDWDRGYYKGFVISAQSGQYWKVNIGDGTDRLDIQGGFIEPGKWHHLAVSFDRDGWMTAYEDGAVVGFAPMEKIGTIDAGLPLVINQDGTTTYAIDFDGSYKDIRIWNAVIAENTLVRWANVPITPDHPNYHNLLANWKCSDGTGNQLKDSSVHANHCQVTGSVNWKTNQSDTFRIFDYSELPRITDNALTALGWMCVPVQSVWDLDGKNWLEACDQTFVNHYSVSSSMTIFPNPAGDDFTIDLSDFGDVKQMLIYDFTGRFIKRMMPDNNSGLSKIDISDLHKGLYLLKADNGENVKVVKVVKK
ncbi:MAG TPA: hypothetical protein DCX89_04805 [Saprospirales bacterium]|nr:hypothetical protein [Saprospirales bacterium]